MGAYVRRSMTPEEDRFVVDKPLQGFRVSPSGACGGTGGARDGAEPLIGAFFKNIKESFKTADTRLDRILTVILIISIILAISMTVYVIVTPKEGEKFTEFYVLGPNGTASEYPTNLTVGEEEKVIVGIVNHEYANVTYQLEVRLNGAVIDEKSIDLTHNETWESPFIFKAKKAGETQKLEFLLHKNGKKEPYRSLHLWLDVT